MAKRCQDIDPRAPTFCARNANHDGRCPEDTCALMVAPSTDEILAALKESDV